LLHYIIATLASSIFAIIIIELRNELNKKAKPPRAIDTKTKHFPTLHEPKGDMTAR
jgi:hypothetical protein